MPTIHSVFEIARKTIQAKKRILLIALVLLLVVSVFVGSSIYKRNYFSHIVSQMLLQYPFADNGVAQDGSYLEIDTNPNNADPDSFSYNSRKASDSLDGIKFVNEKLGFSQLRLSKNGIYYCINGTANRREQAFSCFLDISSEQRSGSNV